MKGRSTRALLAGVCALVLAAQPALAGLSNRELVELSEIDSVGISPDGRFAVFRTERADIGRNSYILRWHSVDLSTGLVRDIGSGGDPIYLDPGAVEPERPLWTSDGRSIVFRALVDGALGLWRADVTGERTRPLVVRDADVEEVSMSSDGRAILYKLGPSRDMIARAERAEYDSGILVDSTVDLSQNLFRGGSINGRMASQRLVGFWFIRDGLLWRSPRQEHRLDLATGVDIAVGSPQAVPAVTVPSIPPPLQARDDQGDVAQAEWDGIRGSLSAKLASGSVASCPDRLCSAGHVSALVWRPGTKDLLVTFIDRERRQSLYLWDTSRNVLKPLASSDGLLSGGRRHMIPCAVSTAAAICVAASAASPPRLERIDLQSGERRSLFDPNGAIRAEYRPGVRFLDWDFGKAGRAAGILMLPPGALPKRAPLYINYYLCEGFLRGGEGDEWPIPKLLDAGFAVACINSVPSPGPQDAVKDDRIALSAIETLIAQLSDEGLIDRTRIAMGGLSHGSEIALWVAAHSNLLAAVSISSGQLEPVNYWAGSVRGGDQPYFYRKVWGLGAPDETPEQWRLVSTALNVSRLHAPILFQLPEEEARRIPELYGRLIRSRTPTELYAFPDEDHIKVQPRHRLAIYERNLDWFRYWLQDYRDEDPAKAEQYRRWDELRTEWKKSATQTSTTEARSRAQPSR